MNFLETLLCLTLIGLLSAGATFGYQALMVRTRLNADVQLVATALYDARSKATQDTPAQVDCLDTRCRVVSRDGEKIIFLSGLNQVSTRLFPVNAQGVFTFTHDGLTAYHNGTITITPPNYPDLTKSIVVSLGGRITLKT